MKKLLLIATSSIAITSLTHAGNLDGAYVGADLGYSWFKVKESGTPPDVFNFSMNAPVVFAKAGYGETFGSVYFGGEGRVGYNFASQSITADSGNSLKLTPSLMAGAAARLGTYLNPRTLLYARFGLDYGRLTAKNSQTKTIVTWSVVPGIGVNYLHSDSIFFSGGIDYSRTMKAENASFKGKPKMVTIFAGVGFKFSPDSSTKDSSAQ